MTLIAFPAIVGVLAVTCAAFVGWDALQRPRPERVIWTVAFVLFAVAAFAEVAGAVAGWNPTLARVYYLCGAVLVVGLLALGEAYLLLPGRVPAIVPGLALLVVAIAVTAVWSAPVDAARLPSEGWRAIERGPFLVALAASINAGGTLALAGGTLSSALTLRSAGGGRRRAAGCLCIALGTLVVALGGTLTRLGRQEYLYLAMSVGIAIIFAGILLTRSTASSGQVRPSQPAATQRIDGASGRAGLTSLPTRSAARRPSAGPDAGIRYIAEQILPLDDEAIADACRRWSASPIAGDALTRAQARQTWALRIALPDTATDRFDLLPLETQAQLGELFAEVWSGDSSTPRDELRA